jgi:hypothetical protein
MPIPVPTAAETEQEFVSRCISEISGEYEQEVAAGICYSTYRQETKMSTQGKISSLLRQEAYKGINLFAEEGDGLENSCWEGYKALGTKILDGREVPNCIPEEDHPDNK